MRKKKVVITVEKFVNHQELIFPSFTELHIPNKHSIGIGNCNDKTGQTVLEASFQHIDFQEFKKWARKKKPKMKPFPPIMHVFGQQSGKAVHGPQSTICNAEPEKRENDQIRIC